MRPPQPPFASPPPARRAGAANCRNFFGKFSKRCPRLPTRSSLFPRAWPRRACPTSRWREIAGAPMIVQVWRARRRIGRRPGGRRRCGARDRRSGRARRRPGGPDRSRAPLGLGPHLRGAGQGRSARPPRLRRQPAGRSADARSRADPRRAGAAGRPRGRHRHPRRRDRRASTSGRTPTWSRSRRRFRPGAAASAARSISAARPSPPARATALSPYRHLRLSPRGAGRASSPCRRAPLEQRERLEQLRALEAGMRIDVALVDAVPLGVDTPADLERARAMLGAQRTALVDDRTAADADRQPRSDADRAIAFQGEPGANSRPRLPRGLSRHGDAALRHLRGRLRRRARRAAPSSAMIPIENSIAGRVADIHHLLPASRPAHHRRAFPAGRAITCWRRRAPTPRRRSRRVHSHVQALAPVPQRRSASSA